MLRSGRTIDSDLLLAAGLPPGPHTLELAAGDDGEVAIAGLTISQERPFGWAFLWLHAAGLLALTLAIRALLRLALVTAGYLPIFRAAGRSGARDRR